jgi:hypothetical protein
MFLVAPALATIMAQLSKPKLLFLSSHLPVIFSSRASM